MNSETTPKPGSLAPTLGVLTLARIMINASRRFPYVILTPMAAALGVPRSSLEAALSAQWAIGALSPLSGPYIDRLGRKRVMLLGLGSLTVVSAVAAMGQVSGVILVALVLLGISKNLYDPAMQAYIADRTPYRLRGMAIGVTELSWSASLLIFGPLAAYLISNVGVNAIFAVLAVTSFIGLILLFLIIPDDAHTMHTHTAAIHPMAILRGHRSAVTILIVGLLVSAASESMSIVYEEWFRNVFAITTAALGVISIAISAAEVSGEGFVIGVSDRFGKRRLLLCALTAVSVVYFVLPLTAGTTVVVATVALFLMYFTFETSVVVLVPLVTEVLPQMRGTMLSASIAAMSIGRAIGTLLGGWMFRTGGMGLNGVVACVLNLIAVGLIWRFVKEIAAPVPIG